ncbi:Cupin domain protein [Legionella massiliensis]|uniref:Cupin domain protein n=1 Tax=Legionella massiliensis TaxID=1034943 RepID=A0A078L5F7_9GAMM|nr:cupin domain-containing protein [Legionella massiliensis]CDZ79324.1 Cupin domain protein [Legionella massiliensis]CEE15062.1 Cupin domain protein [Legionella massiliensis]
MRQLANLAVLISSFIVTAESQAASDNQSATQPILIKAADVQFHPAPGFPKGAQIVLLQGDLSKAEPYTIRFKLPDGFVIPAHWHTTDEEVTVLSGTFNVGTGDKVDKSQSTALTAGGFQVVPAKVHHYVWASGETVVQLDGMGPRTTTFVNPAEWTDMIKNSSK